MESSSRDSSLRFQMSTWLVLPIFSRFLQINGGNLLQLEAPPESTRHLRFGSSSLPSLSLPLGYEASNDYTVEPRSRVQRQNHSERSASVHMPKKVFKWRGRR